MTQVRGRSRAVALVGAAALLLTGVACSAGGSTPTPTPTTTGTGPTGSLRASGSKVQFSAFEPWRVSFVEAHPGVTINYEPIGSGHGTDQFLAGTIDLAAIDEPLGGSTLRDARARCGGEVIQLPVQVSGVALVYSVPGVTSLRLSPATLTAIFTQQITRWDDPLIARDNPGVDLPDLRLRTVHRLDEAWQSQTLSAYLSEVDPREWPYPATPQWPVTDGGRAAKGSEELLEVVADGLGRIGYATMGQTTPQSGKDVRVAAIRVDSRSVTPTPDSAAAALDAGVRTAPRSATNLAVSRGTQPTVGKTAVYPVVSVSYQVACADQPTQEKADLLRQWLTWVTSSQAQQAAADASGSAPIGAAWRERAAGAVTHIRVAKPSTSGS